METALYFPYVNVPNSGWFTHILLYWDRAASIVPASLKLGDSDLSQYMRELQQFELLEFVDPDSRLWECDDAFGKAFIALVDARAPSNSTDRLQYTRIHTGKMVTELFNELAARGLAKRSEDPGWETWWNVESSTADIYMGYLAAALCGRLDSRGHKAYPVTDKQVGIAMFSGKGGTIEDKLRDLRYHAIMNALPVPSTPLRARDIYDFKIEHGEKLARLRRHLDSRLVDIAAIEESELRALKARLAVDEIRDDVEVLREKMGKRNWPKVALVGVGGVIGTAISVLSGVVTAGTSTLALGLAVGGGLVSTGGAGFQAVEMLRAPGLDKSAPLAYAALAPG